MQILKKARQCSPNIIKGLSCGNMLCNGIVLSLPLAWTSTRLTHIKWKAIEYTQQEEVILQVWKHAAKSKRASRGTCIPGTDSADKPTIMARRQSQAATPDRSTSHSCPTGPRGATRRTTSRIAKAAHPAPRAQFYIHSKVERGPGKSMMVAIRMDYIYC